MIKVKKLPNGKYEVEETIPSNKQTSIVNKVVLEETIRAEEKEIANRQEILNKRKEILIEINKAK